ncbi:hypothetical protein KQI42_01540 [Tissierella sp. MSJ-40]|uniref:Immunity protein 30 domain-containing protein n=1 Tax=Tissierella simiarum TaxID=2841534 RepID=A0ABS6E1K0_9FIRM|nr:hypothetical protein [Tissierella simiarum]MBU5436669.1 hypothetical protein [Tissierella simiarum]
MKIYIENQILEYENNKDEIDNILTEIDDIITNSSKTLSYMIIDDFEVFNNYYDYFLDNIRVIEKIEVVSVTYKELINDILNSTLDYLERTPNLIDELANSFYKNPNRESWKNLNDLLEGIGWLIDTFSSIDRDKRLKDIVLNYENWNLYAEGIFSIKEILGDFEAALSNDDYISIADILLYEISPKFKEMAKNLLGLVSREAALDGLS